MLNMTSWIKMVTILCGAAALFACSNGNSNGPLVDSTGKHPANWLENHWVDIKQAKEMTPAEATSLALSCAECHGKDLLGGIAKVSCFSAQAQNGQQCHATTLGHPDGWDNAAQHGEAGAMAAPGISSGFVYCARCHGSDFRGGTGKAVSCFSCHTTAPHPPKPWRGTTTSGTTHVNANTANAAECAKCHLNGTNLVGQQIGAIAPAGTAPGCFNGTLCHDTSVAPHPANASFLSPAAHGPLAKANLAICQACHATPASGNNPRFNVPRNNLINGCESCHKINTVHPTPWLPGRIGTPGNTANSTTHASAGNMATACAICHVTNGTTGAAAGVPPCMSCHTASSPVTTPTGCTSCHASLPTSGAHAKHLGLPNVTCQACHFGAGATGDINTPAIGTAKHADGTLDVALLDIDPASNSYLAKTGNFSLNPVDKTCTNVRCHGGGDPTTHTTPNWTTGALTVNTDCLKCHEQVGNTPQTPQFNSFFSGSFGLVNLHQFHLLQTNPGSVRLVFCTDCHNTASLTNQQHFGGLATSAFTAPGNTISGGSTRIGSYDTTVKRCSGITCHTLAPPNVNWVQ